MLKHQITCFHEIYRNFIVVPSTTRSMLSSVASYHLMALCCWFSLSQNLRRVYYR